MTNLASDLQPLASLNDIVGRTPLVELRRLARGLPGRIVVKLETANPTGSVKDRVAKALVDEAEASGALRAGGTVVAATSGNTGLALAQIATARGYRVRLVIPEQWSSERVPLLLYMGADVVRTPGATMKPAVERAEKEATTSNAVLLDQFHSPANPDVHRRTTAEEIWRETDGQVAAFVAGVGTGGTITGVALGLRAHRSDVRIVAVEPAGSAVLSGARPGPHAIQGIGAGFVPPLLRRDLVDEVIAVTDDEAFERARDLSRIEGILAGVSSGATLSAALKVAARREMAGRLVVMIAADSGERYITTPYPASPTPRPRRRG